MTKPSIARELTRQMKFYGPGLGPIDLNELYRKFPDHTQVEIEKAVLRWAARRGNVNLLRYGERQLAMETKLISVLEGYTAGADANTFTELEEAAKQAVDCVVPIGWQDAIMVGNLTDTDVKRKTVGDAARALLRWMRRREMPSLAELQVTTPWPLDAKLFDQILRELDN
jgi:hypothetical protein